MFKSWEGLDLLVSVTVIRHEIYDVLLKLKQLRLKEKIIADDRFLPAACGKVNWWVQMLLFLPAYIHSRLAEDSCNCCSWGS